MVNADVVMVPSWERLVTINRFTNFIFEKNVRRALVDTLIPYVGDLQAADCRGHGIPSLYRIEISIANTATNKQPSFQSRLPKQSKRLLAA